MQPQHAGGTARNAVVHAGPLTSHWNSATKKHQLKWDQLTRDPVASNEVKDPRSYRFRPLATSQSHLRPVG